MKKLFAKSFVKRPKFFIAIACLTLHGAWINYPSGISKAEWLIGTWENKTRRGTIYESWVKTGETELAGKSFMIKDKDTIVFENIKLVQEPGGLFYIPTVKGQNQGLPVRFKGRSISETQLIFENPAHDFPQIISYTKISADSLVAEISGMRNGQERKQQFPMRRVK